MENLEQKKNVFQRQNSVNLDLKLQNYHRKSKFLPNLLFNILLKPKELKLNLKFEERIISLTALNGQKSEVHVQILHSAYILQASHSTQVFLLESTQQNVVEARASHNMLCEERATLSTELSPPSNK